MDFKGKNVLITGGSRGIGYSGTMVGQTVIVDGGETLV